MYRVAYISRATLYQSPGGDTHQLEETARELRKQGLKIDIYLASQTIPYQDYDLLHFFNIIRPADILGHIDRTDTPFVVSTIFVEYGDMGAGGWASRINRWAGADALEYIKVLARYLKNGEKINSRRYLYMGHRRAIRELARRAALLLPNSHSEYQRFCRSYGLNPEYRVVPNGINLDFVERNYDPDPDYDQAVICMGRIEWRKNQLQLIRAIKDTPYRLFIHGQPSPNNQDYYQQCLEEANEQVTIGGWLEPEALYRAYQSARVHVLPSYFETTGLSSLEAAAMGCQIVITDRGDTREYFEDFAWYCEPESVDSIRKAIRNAFEKVRKPGLKERILSRYTWARAAEETLKAYNQVLG